MPKFSKISISTFVVHSKSLICGLLLCGISITAYSAEPKKGVVTNTTESDSIPLLRGVAVSIDLAGALIRQFSDHGQYEAALRVNLKDKYFPVIEAGYGDGSHDTDVVTGLKTASKGPFGRIGCDYNIMKNKHDDYRIYAGLRYGFAALTSDISNPTYVDPVYGGPVGFSVEGKHSTYHWLEGAFTMDAKITGHFRAGWSVRYRRKLTSTGVETGQLWFVPGYGTDSGSKWSGLFYVTMEL